MKTPRTPQWLARAITIGYPLGIAALALLRITQGQYETALYMLTTAGLFALNTRFVATLGKMFVLNHEAGKLMTSLLHANEEAHAALAAAQQPHDDERKE